MAVGWGVVVVLVLVVVDGRRWVVILVGVAVVVVVVLGMLSVLRHIKRGFPGPERGRPLVSFRTARGGEGGN